MSGIVVPPPPDIIVAQAAAGTSVSTLTVLEAFTNRGSKYRGLLYTLINLDGSNTVDLILETSQDGTRPDSRIKWQETAAAGEQVSVEIDATMRFYWRLSAQTASPGFPTVSVKWEIRGVPRLA